MLGLFAHIQRKEKMPMFKSLVSTESMNKEEWIKWRNKGIGGSDASVVCGLNKYKSALELWMEKTGQIEPKESGEAAYWGTVLEPIIRNEFTKRTGFEVGIEKSILQHPYHPFMLANVDGIVLDNEKKCGYIFEAKTSNAYLSHNWDIDIPEAYQLQVLHYMAVTGLSGAYIAVLIGGNDFRIYFIERNNAVINLLINLEKRFWDCVENNTPPSLDGSNASKELLSRLYPTGKTKDVITLPSEAIDLIKQYEEANGSENEVILKKNEAANKLKEMLGENQYGSVGNRTVCWTNVNSEKLDINSLKAEQPEIYSKFLLKSSYRRFSIK